MADDFTIPTYYLGGTYHPGGIYWGGGGDDKPEVCFLRYDKDTRWIHGIGNDKNISIGELIEKKT